MEGTEVASAQFTVDGEIDKSRARRSRCNLARMDTSSRRNDGFGPVSLPLSTPVEYQLVDIAATSRAVLP